MLLLYVHKNSLVVIKYSRNKETDIVNTNLFKWFDFYQLDSTVFFLIIYGNHFYLYKLF